MNRPFEISLLCLFLLTATPVLAAEQTALTMVVAPGVISILDGKTENLAAKIRLSLKSIVRSDATGKAQFMFPDDSTVNIAPETQIELMEFVDTPEEENIILNMSTGVARFITGELSKRNPAAFTVQTPQAIIGIRGTIVTVEVSGDVTRVYLTETSGKGVNVRNRATGENIRMRKPGALITVGPAGMEERKASATEAKNFAQLLRGKYSPAATRARARSAALAQADASLAAQGHLPFTNSVDVAQMDQYNRQALMKNATQVAGIGGASASSPTPVVPVVPVVPPVPDNPGNTPASPGNTPATPASPGGNPATSPDVPNVPEIPDNPTVPDTPVVGPDVPSTTPPVEAYTIMLADVAGTYSTNVSIPMMNSASEVLATVNGQVAFTIPENYITMDENSLLIHYDVNFTNVTHPRYMQGNTTSITLPSLSGTFITGKNASEAEASMQSVSGDSSAGIGLHCYDGNGNNFLVTTLSGTTADGTRVAGTSSVTNVPKQ